MPLEPATVALGEACASVSPTAPEAGTAASAASQHAAAISRRADRRMDVILMTCP